ncbi:MAG: glycosyltransferase [Planctomycetaceae bacterium]|nr:glycosyltransferase [Planctomycetaceae bacterium]
MTRILLVIPTLDRSGAEKQLTLLATHLPRDQFELHVVALTRGGPYAETLRQHGIPLTILGKRFRFDPLALYRLRRLIREYQPDVVHSWLFAGNSYCRMVAGGPGQPPVMVAERCVDSWKAGWQLWLDRRQIDRTARLVGNSRAVADFYLSQGFPADRVQVIPNAVESNDLLDDQAATTRAAVLQEFDLPPEARVVACTGRMARQKRITDLVWAFQVLRQCTENVYFLVVGDGPERPRCERLAVEFDCQHLCRFVGHREDVPRLLQAVDVLWLASDFEGQSNSLMEAMAAGIPVVASEIPANQELIENGVNGYLVSVGDSVGFSQFTDRLLNDAGLSRRVGAAARQRMREEFSIEKMVQAHVEAYEEISARFSVSRPGS